MKLKEIFFGLGLRPPTREYPFDIERIHLPKEGEIDVALWRHPSAVRRQRKGRGFHLAQRDIDVLRAFLNPGDVAIDIGAHTGDSTLPIALAVGKTGTVFALEPNIHAFKVLLANVALNTTRTTIVPLNIAATPEDGTYQFEYSDAGFCNGGLHQGISPWKHAHFFKLEVEGRNVPAYLAKHFPEEARRIRYVKIDTEGFDRQVTASMRGLLSQLHPFIKTEIYTHSLRAERERYYRDLRDLGYRLYRIDDDADDYRSHPIGENDLMKWSHFDMFAVPEASRGQ